MRHSYLTEDIDSFYMLIGILVHNGFDLDFDYMYNYRENHTGHYLVLVRGD